MKKKRAHPHPALAILIMAALTSSFLFVVARIDFFPAVYRASDKNLLASVGSVTQAQTGGSAEVTAGSSGETAQREPGTSTQLDRALYDKDMLSLANITPVTICVTVRATSTKTVALHGTSTAKVKPVKTCSTAPAASAWPTKAAYPNAGALLPFNRIVAYYGNFYSTNMGVLGQYPSSILIPKLQSEIAKWKAADPNTPVIPAVDYIASTAQGAPGSDAKYRLRMPDDQIQKAISLANQMGGIVFLDVQTGQSTMETEVPLLEKYLELPNVELALDPEFSMKAGQKPGSRIGSIDASDVNFAAQYLAKIVQKNNLAPKILVVHRFTEGMVTDSESIKPLPEVQVVMDMDGWGDPAHKTAAYREVIVDYPVQFTGFKLFYKNDVRGSSTGMLTPAQVLKLSPMPSYIQYQ